jgi:hypothetical protein
MFEMRGEQLSEQEWPSLGQVFAAVGPDMGTVGGLERVADGEETELHGGSHYGWAFFFDFRFGCSPVPPTRGE